MEENQENIFTGKSVDEAIIEGLQALNLTLDEVDVEVIEEGKKKLFSTTKAKIRMTKKSEGSPKTVETKAVKTPKATATKTTATKATKATKAKSSEVVEGGESTIAVEFVNKLLNILSIEGSAALVEDEGENIKIDITTSTTAKVIGKRGDILDSIQAMAGAVANIGREDYKKVVVDCEGYRTQREESLKQLAAKLEKMAVDTGKKVILEPMNPYERRIIHAALVESTQVKTASEGREPIRYVVVIPNGADPKDRGIRYGGNNRSRQGGRGGFQRGGQRSGGRNFHSRDGEKREGRPYGDRPYNKDRGERGDRPYGDRPYNKDRGERGDRPYGDRPYNKDRGERGDRPYGDRPYNKDRNAGGRPRSGAPRAKKEIIFGTYLGNSQKDKKDDNKSEE